MHCGKPLKDETEEYCPDCGKRLAGKHVDSRNPQRSALDQGRSLWLHREPVSGALYRFIPVPLHPSRRRKRGFNQAEILAEELGKLCGIPVETDVLFRIRKTAPQKVLGREGRMKNLRGAFGVSAGWNPCGNVLLIDDIYTTGATLERAAAVLKKAGVQKVFFLTISIGQGI